MLVGSRMTFPVITAGPLMTLAEALQKIDENKIHAMPVTDPHGRLLGLVSRSLLTAAIEENPANSEKCVEDFMERVVLTVTDGTTIEEAARIILDYDIPLLPVLQDNFVVGVLTPTQLIRILIEMTGTRQSGVRVTLKLKDRPEQMLKILNAISELNGNIHSLNTFCGEEMDEKILMFKVENIDKFVLKQILTPLSIKLVDIR